MIVALTQFVSNVKDLSDEGGYKFRFHCDKCGDGFESQYVAGSANLLKTAVDLFSLFRPLGGYGTQGIAKSIDRGLRGKERDTAYETAVHQAMVFFKKCNGCGKWVCPKSCWNHAFGMCEACAPNAAEEKTKKSAQHLVQKVVADTLASNSPDAKSLSCQACGHNAGDGKFCEHCGATMAQDRSCKGCGRALKPATKFCPDCGAKT
ncbi:MAG: hypothetical protein EBU49_09735 [Proteobacteria bacterium]|nr:hypothetical protein [Pseudomonadota bacterium]